MKQHSCRSSIAVVLIALGAVYGYFHTGSPAAACGVPLSVQDIQNGIMPSDANLPCSSNRQGSPQAQQPRGPSEQQVRWQKASQLNSEGMAAADRSDFATATARYQQALDLFKLNGDQKNIAIVQKNLAITRKLYAPIRDDNRVIDAQSHNADQDIYTKPNPFSKATPAGTTFWCSVRT